MKLVIAGSRTANLVNIQLPVCEICHLFGINLDSISEVVSGGANGADKLGEMFAKFFSIEVKQFLPDYDNAPNKKTAPLERNTLMAKHGDVLLLIWDGKSKGSLDMQKKMEAEGKPVHVYTFSPEVEQYDFNQKLDTEPQIKAAEARCTDLTLIFPTTLEAETEVKASRVRSSKTRPRRPSKAEVEALRAAEAAEA